jgi:N-acyl-D-aspartate/D-glutamate deacylase
MPQICMHQWAVIALGALGLAAVTSASEQGLSADKPIVLAGGTVVDGSGAAPYAADVVVRGERITAIGPRLAESAPPGARIIDVRGLVVAPGFIEPHAHISTIDQHPDATNYLRQGVTTIVASLHGLDQPYPLGLYLDDLHVAPNTVWTAGHTWERKRVLGLADREPTPDELKRMEALVREAMDDGAIGLGTGLEYVPSAYAKPGEVLALARAAVRPGAMYVTHLRDEGPRLLPALDEAIAVGRSAGLPVHISHVKTTGRANWGQSRAALQRIDAANASGVRTTFDVYAYTAYSTVSDVLFPAWALAGSAEDFRARIADPVARARLKSEMTGIYAEQTAGELSSVQFRDGPPGFAGKTLADYLQSTGHPATLDAAMDALIDLQAAGGFLAVFHAMDERDVEAFLRHPMACVSADGDLVTFGQGIPHPRSYGGFPRVLSRYVRERGTLSLPEAIRKMTGQPAAFFGLAERGLVRVGYYADLVVFDPSRVADQATYAAPHQYPIGIPHVLVNGKFVIDSGEQTGQRPGHALRRGRDGFVQ